MTVFFILYFPFYNSFVINPHAAALMVRQHSLDYRELGLSSVSISLTRQPLGIYPNGRPIW